MGCSRSKRYKNENTLTTVERSQKYMITKQAIYLILPTKECFSTRFSEAEHQ